MSNNSIYNCASVRSCPEITAAITAATIGSVGLSSAYAQQYMLPGHELGFQNVPIFTSLTSFRYPNTAPIQGCAFPTLSKVQALTISGLLTNTSSSDITVIFYNSSVIAQLEILVCKNDQKSFQITFPSLTGTPSELGFVSASASGVTMSGFYQTFAAQKLQVGT